VAATDRPAVAAVAIVVPGVSRPDRLSGPCEALAIERRPTDTKGKTPEAFMT
jgi:hypothetical protein